MNTRERLYLVILALIAGAAGVSLAAISTAYLSLEQLGTSLASVHGNFYFVLISALLVVLAVTFLLVALRRGDSVETLLQQGPLGDVRICFKAVENLVLKASRNVKGVRDTKTRIVYSGTGLVIYLRAVTYPDQSIPQVTAELQTAVKEYVESITGAIVSEVKVMVENVVTDAVKAAR
jgi:uncharacterized alkaline shock family protein YloU